MPRLLLLYCSNKRPVDVQLQYMKTKFVMLSMDVTQDFTMDVAHYQVQLIYGCLFDVKVSLSL